MFYCVGNVQRFRIDEDLLQDAESELREPGKRDIVISPGDAVQIALSKPDDKNIDLLLKIRTHQKNHRFVVAENSLCYQGEGDFAVLRSIIDAFAEESGAEYKLPTDILITAAQGMRFTRLKTIVKLLWIYACASIAAWLLLKSVRDAIVSISIAAALAVFVLYLIFPNELTVIEKKKNAGGRIQIAELWIILLIFPMLQLTYENIMNWPRLLMITAFPCGVMLLLYLIRIREWRMKKGLLVAPLFVCFVLCLCAVGHVNNWLDAHPAQGISCVIEEKSRSSRSGRHIFVVMDGKRQKLKVPLGMYADLSPGEQIDLYRHDGALGIAYVTIEQRK